VGLVLCGLVLALAVSGAWAWRQQAAPPGPHAALPPEPSARAAPRAAGPKAQAPEPEVPALLRVAGRARDRAGRPLPGARVAVLAPQQVWRGRDAVGDTPLAEVGVDAEGAFGLDVSADLHLRSTERQVRLVAWAEGHAPVGLPVRLEGEPPALDVCLPRPQSLRGRLLTDKGGPARGVRVEVIQIGPVARLPQGPGGARAGRLPFWPAPVTTDARGEFVLGGLCYDQTVRLQLRGPAVAQQVLALARGPARPDGPLDPLTGPVPSQAAWPRLTFTPDGQGATFTHRLPPSRALEGKVVTADTAEPLASARLLVVVAGPADVASRCAVLEEGWTDGAGRFRLRPASAGGPCRLEIYPAEGAPYLPRLAVVEAAAKATEGLTVELPRGLPVRGTVTDAATGRPVAGAEVGFLARQADNPFYRKDVIDRFTVARSGEDGAFRLVVPPGTGHLLVTGPSAEHVAERTDWGTLRLGKAMPAFVRAHRVVPLSLRPGEVPPEVRIALKRGVRVTGEVTRPDGTPLDEGVVFCPSQFERRVGDTPVPILVRKGRFVLPGCDRALTYPVLAVDRTETLAALAELPAAGGRPHPIRLAPCGSAVARFVDEKGRPVAGQRVAVLMLLPHEAPGVAPLGQRLTDVRQADSFQRLWSGQALEANAQGLVKATTLVPGALYQLKWLVGNRIWVTPPFTVGPGEARTLGDIAIKPGR
jgi:hypothetical protein